MLLEISVLIIAVFMVVLVIGILFTLSQIRKTAKEAEKFLDTARQQIVPISHDLTIILNDSKKIVQSIERQVGTVEQGVEAIKETAQNVRNFEAEIQERIEQPLIEISTLISAIARVLRGIVDYFHKDNGLLTLLSKFLIH